MRTRLGLLIIASLCFVHACALGQVVTKTEMLTMADGVKLATDVHWPSTGNPPYPTILVRTPYNKNGVKAIATVLCAQGYAVVAQDMRGRFASEGKPIIIFGNEGLGEHQDGHETIAWIAKQRWSNKRVVSWGGSAVGISQNMAAPGAPEALKGQVVQVAFSNYYRQAAYQGGVWRKELLGGWLKGTNMEEGNLPTFLAHPYEDEFWKALNSEARAAQVNAPGVFSGGWYDIFLQGTINAFKTIQEQGGPDARGKCVLVIAPIGHGQITELSYPANGSQFPVDVLQPKQHFAAWLKGDTAAIAGIKPVHYYVMGDPTDSKAPGNFWRSVDSWPPPAKQTPYYFHADKTLSTKPSIGEGKLTYAYDPTNPVPTVGGQNLTIPLGPKDQRKVEDRPDVLVFTTDTLTEPVEVTGRLTAKLFISSDCPDTDFTVKLCDVYPDGRSMLVTDGIQRASLRNTFEKPEFLEAGKVYELNVDLWSTSLIFNKGHKIRVSVSSSNDPRFEPNANNGEPHPVPGKTRIANNTLHLSADHASYIDLPIYAGD